MIIFKLVKWKNFLSTGNIYTEMNLNDHATTLIIGENGSGKSTLLDALSFALFGKAFREVNKPQLINTINKKDSVVEVEFNIGTNKYKIIRGQKPDIFQVFKNDVLINQTANNKDYQTHLERNIIKVNHKSFCQVVVLGSATFKPFMQLEKGKRREIIEDLLDLQIFTSMNTILKEKIINNNDAIVQANSNRKLVESRINLLKEHFIEIQNNNVQLIEDKKSRIEETNLSIEQLNKDYTSQKSIIDDLSKNIENESKFTDKIQQLSSLKHKIEAKLSVVHKEVQFFLNMITVLHVSSL